MSVMAVKLILLHAFIACTVDFIPANGLDVIHGRYTRDIHDYEVAIPHQLTPSGDFLTYRLPSHYQHQYSSGQDAQQQYRKRRGIPGKYSSPWNDREPAHVHYSLPIKGKRHHLELWPNHGLVAPNAIVEHRSARDRVQDRRIKKLSGGKFCHYTGHVRGDPKSKVALTTCGGLAGYVTTAGKRYFVEPVLDHEENHLGQLTHVVYEQEPHRCGKRTEQEDKQRRSRVVGGTADVNPILDEHAEELRVVKSTPYCGTNKNWMDAWRSRFRTEELAAVSKAAKASAASGGSWASTLQGQQCPGTNVDTHSPLWSSSDVADGKSESRRGLQSVHRYLETLIVADKKFLDHHKDTDYDTYVMTIMNMVSDYYHDASAGNQMDVVVVRLMYLEKEEEEIDLEISADADKTLASFCKWQAKVNPEDIRNPNHHDIAVLLTRYDICADNLTSCGLMGLAYVATACTKDQPCAINEDSGLILGIVVAHEMGHVMGCAHDSEEESGCTPQAEDESYHVMSPYVHQHTTKWSTCSRAFITTLFDNDLGECLNDEPEISLYDGANTMLAGTVYDATYQCQMSYPGSKVCKTDPEKFCTILLCRTDPETCMGNGEPPADGTKCGENKWCYNLKCVEIGERPDAINGGWGDWGTWSECSRSCGGGIMFSERDCNDPQPQHNGRYCIGNRRKVKICNTSVCPENLKSFRAQQCEAHNTIPFNGINYTWSPYLKEEDPCVLYCLNEENIFTKLEPRCKDGTRCKLGTKNMCVAGACKNVGCDYVLDSDAVEDECGECRGDGTTCKLVTKTFSGLTGHGYVKMGVISKGCRNILIEELGPSDNTLAVKNADETVDFLNGKFTEATDGVKDIGGSHAVYTHPEPNKEMLLIHGPLQEDIVIYVVFYDNKNIGYQYKYAEPTVKDETSYQPIHHWEFIEWGECSSRCGGGSEIAEAQCVEERAGKVSNSFCSQETRPPPKSRVCNEMPCPIRWRVGKWSICRPCKDEGGVRTREIECIRQAKRPGTEDVLVEDNLCTDKRPDANGVCTSKLKCKTRNGKLFRAIDADDEVGMDEDEDAILGKLTPKEVGRQLWMQSLGPVWNYAGLKMDMFPNTFDERDTHRIVHKTPDVKLVCVPVNKTHHDSKPSKDKEKDKNNHHEDAEGKNKADNTDIDKDTKTENKVETKEHGKENVTEESKPLIGKAEKINQKTIKNHTTEDVGGKETSGSGKSVAEGGKVVLQPGSIAHDPVSEDAIKEISVHVKQSHGSLNLTDDAFEAMGDKVPDTLDFANMQVQTGEKAAQVKKEQARANHSIEHSIDNR